MIGGKRMQQNYCGALPLRVVNNFRVAALYLPGKHAALSIGRYGFVTRCTPTGADNRSGSSGMMIQAMG